MTYYDIKPSGVGSVVSKVGGYLLGDGGEGGDGGGLVRRLEIFGNHIGQAGTAAASGPVGAALKEYVEYASPGLIGMVEKGGACITGVGRAVREFEKGDGEMLAVARRVEVSAPAPRIGR